jgi:hypothetical protein
VITDLVQIERLGASKRKENERFRKHLKTFRFVERRLVRMAQETEAAIDCTVCANCCKVATVRLLPRDVEGLAKRLRLKPVDFVRDYCEESPEEGLILGRNDAGCVFLEGPPFDVRGLPAPGPRRRLAPFADVGDARPRHLLPDCVQHTRSLEGRGGVPALSRGYHP